MIDKNLNLRHFQDRDYFYNLLQKENNLPYSFEDIKSSINFILSHIRGDEWLKIYPVPSIVSDISLAVKVGQLTVSLDFLYEVIPLGLNLIRLQDLNKFNRIIASLNIPTHERASTMFEARVAPTYRGLGYTVDLEPPNGRGQLCDLGIKPTNLNEWIYIECKSENLDDRRILQARQEIAQSLTRIVHERAKEFLHPSYRIDIQATSNIIKKKKNDKWLNDIIVAVKNNEIEQWKESEGIRYCINLKKNQLQIPPNHIYSGVAVLPGNIPVSLYGSSSVCVFYPVGSYVVRNISKLLMDGRKKLPDNYRGIIAIKVFDTSLLKSIIPRIKNVKYRTIIAVIAIASTNAFIIKNNTHNDIPNEILKIPTLLCA